MSNFDNRGSQRNRSRYSSGRDFGRRDNGRDGGRREMHKAVCSNCGKDCEVPFRPTGDKPVLCDDCFGKRSDRPRRSDSGRSRDHSAPRGDGSNKLILDQLVTLNSNVEKLITLLAPTKTLEVVSEDEPEVVVEAEAESKPAKKTTRKAKTS